MKNYAKLAWNLSWAALAALALLLCAMPSMAQQTSTILGAVKDSSGASVPGANITITSIETSVVRTTVTGEDGAYRVAGLQPGHYSVKIEKTGFKTATAANLTLDVAQELVVNPTVEVGSTSQEVVVTGEAPVVNTTSSSLGGLVNDEKMSDLPLNGRNFIDLSLMQAGVAQNKNQGSGGGIAGTYFSANGAPTRSNYMTLDGAPMMNQMGGSTGSEAGTTLGVDGIKEFKVITINFSADYGMTMGSQMVMASKGGSNRFHGDGFEYLRNSALDARNYFDPRHRRWVASGCPRSDETISAVPLVDRSRRTRLSSMRCMRVCDRTLDSRRTLQFRREIAIRSMRPRQTISAQER